MRNYWTRYFNYRTTGVFLLLVSFSLGAQTKRSQVLVLGTTHLHAVDSFAAPMVGPVIDQLVGMDFDVVAIEKMPGELLYDIQARRDSAWGGLLNMSGVSSVLELADTVRHELEISLLTAERRVTASLRQTEFSPSERHDLILQFIALTDLPSAVLQLTYLEQPERVFTSPFDRYVLSKLQRLRSAANEYYSLAVPLAKRLGLNRLAAIDNLQDESLMQRDFPAFYREFTEQSEQLMKIMDLPVFKRVAELLESGVKEGDLSELYEYTNSEEFVTDDYEAQWKLWLKTDFSSKTDRARYSLWEMRNLQITANILRVLAAHPGERMVVIIGASHKGFLEKYLRQIEDIEVLSYE